MSQMAYIILLPFFLKSQLFAPPIDFQEFSAYIKEKAHMKQIYEISNIYRTAAMANYH